MPKNRTAPQRSRLAWVWLAVALLLVGVVGGAVVLSRGSAHRQTAADHPMTMPDHFPNEPEWYKTAIGPVKEAYLAAAYNNDVLRHIPCYCGCGAVHASNSACYFTRNPQGEVVAWDQHAYG